MNVKTIGVGILLVFLPTIVLAQKDFPFREESQLTSHEGEARYVTLALGDSLFRLGELYKVDYTSYNGLENCWVYNWAFNSLVPLPGQLAIYDADKKYIGDLIAFTGGSRRTVEASDWVFLFDGSHVGRTIRFRAGLVPGTKYDSINSMLPAGHYFIQLILYRAFLSNNPFSIEGDGKPDFVQTFDRSEAIRSNVIAIDIL